MIMKTKEKSPIFIGQKLLHAKIIDCKKNPPNGRKIWICECECGIVYSARSYLLNNGMKQHCGCKRASNLINQYFGNGKVILYLGCYPYQPKNKSKNVKYNNVHWWKVECKCGVTYEANSSSLIFGHKNSCGCSRTSSKFGQILRRHWISIVKNARYSKIEFTITPEYANELYDKQDKKCNLSGIQIIFANSAKEHDKGGTTASLDRIDSTKGYIEGNVQWIHKHINNMKLNHNQEYFIYLCKAISNHQPKIIV